MQTIPGLTPIWRSAEVKNFSISFRLNIAFYQTHARYLLKLYVQEVMAVIKNGHVIRKK